MSVTVERLFGRLAVAGPSRLHALARHASTSAATSSESVEADSASPVAEEPKWAPGVKRTGLLAVKKGMTAMFDEHGERIPATVLQLDSVYVYNRKLRPHLAVQVCSTPKRHTTKAMAGVYAAREATADRPAKPAVPISLRAAEFKVDADGMLPIGERLRAAHFVPGQFVDVKAKTRGKGFQGGMKRWGFAGQEASHGNTKAHRKIGSIGASARPARVHKNKKMPGRMGGLNQTLYNLLVLRIDTELDLLFVKGPVPGPKGAHIRVTDARRKAPRESVLSLPFPAGTDSALAKLGPLPREITLAKFSKRDPHAPVDT